MRIVSEAEMLDFLYRVLRLEARVRNGPHLFLRDVVALIMMNFYCRLLHNLSLLQKLLQIVIALLLSVFVTVLCRKRMLLPFKPETSQPVYAGIEYGNLRSCLNVCVQFCLVDFVLYKKGGKGLEIKSIPVATLSLL